jgi:type II secretory pathway pseudopilin PulG
VKLVFDQPRTSCRSAAGNRRGTGAFTLAEVVVAAALAAITVAGVIYGHIQSQERADWSGSSLAAQALAVQRLEQTRAARWDTEAGVDQLVAANFPAQVLTLDLPMSGTNMVYATNFTTITDLSTNAPMLKMIRVDCVWRWNRTNRLLTNTVVTYRAPDNT